MTSHDQPPLDLHAIAHRAMIDAQFEPDFPAEATQQLRSINEVAVLAATPHDIPDLRLLLWSSIDNHDSRDLDQVEWAEPLDHDEIRVIIGIADVDALVPVNSPIDRHAQANAGSVYTGVATFPMLPEQLSTDLSSLAEAQDRLAIAIDLTVATDGTITTSAVYRALVRNQAQLAYESIGPWLEGTVALPPEVAKVAGLDQQLQLQDRVAERLHSLREKQGALDFETVEASPITAHGDVVDLTVQRKNRARYLIENLMIAANTAMAGFLTTNHIPAIQRVVRAPERWDRIVALAAHYGASLPVTPDAPALSHFLSNRKAADALHFPDLSLSVVKLLGSGEYTVIPPGEAGGHFGLAANAYTHSTAPNRRFADLIIQRLLKAALAHQPAPYSIDQLTELAAHCTERDHAAKKVERLMRKVAAARFMSHSIGTRYDAVVTGVTPKGTFVRLITPPVEGQLVRGADNLDVGDQLSVRLVSTNPARGFIDFERTP
ncbi:MAG: RNB domain-containing ribonuclease [Herpetosiphon sp.]